ncbi:peroxisome proliferator-activated receptor gamma coactivator-related [Pyrenophora seminiperda CCB06]|uniref:Peroxisome proliferator-activated receptor gamma coactivator-related n=1 Tax=Pyrenophora seminiperda CCB06 TaxID=1302712 RepID=A0A3M7M8M3_9PLEO|nr:peroxisome proliferator-activated receptor gamma coactivator-related [Pyrenophora seminiperda CCB06]
MICRLFSSFVVVAFRSPPPSQLRKYFVKAERLRRAPAASAAQQLERPATGADHRHSFARTWPALYADTFPSARFHREKRWPNDVRYFLNREEGAAPLRKAQTTDPMRSSNKTYTSINENSGSGRGNDFTDGISWYWRLVALAASWMILGGYLILPGLYANDAQLRFSDAVLSVFVVALLTAGYSFTALLCFACRNDRFQADGVFLPALTSSVLGLVSIAYNFLSSHAYRWGTAAISGTVISTGSTVLYAILLLWKYRCMAKTKEHVEQRSNLWSEQSYYSNFVANMYPTATRSPPQLFESPYTEEDRVKQQMALLLHKSDAHTSPDTNSTFRIDLPEDREQQERVLNSQELVGTPAQAHRNRTDSRPDSLGETQAWQHWQDRGRSTIRASSSGGTSSHSRNLSREERRREIELGQMNV